MPGVTERLNRALEGRYRLDQELGEGGMATVYVADDLRHERRVALKVLKPELAAVVGAERFLAEIRTTANLQHPHILPLFDSGEADGFLYYVMPLVEGESLRDKLAREHQLPVVDAVRIATDLAEAIDYAHRHDVIHRDIKPGNILIHDSQPVIADFGIALAVNAGGAGRLTETGLSLGTPHYMSPEQATGDAHVGPATDTYALACVLYEMLVGDPPYTGATPQAILGKIITSQPEPLSAERRSVPANVEAAVAKALEKLPADRFASTLDFAAALADPGFRHGAAAAIHAFPALRRWRRWTLAGWAAAAVLALAFGWALLRPGSDGDVTRFRIPAPVGVDLATPSHFGLAVSPDGRTVVFGDWGSTGQLYRHQLGQLESVAIPGTENGYFPFLSHDGEWLGFFDQDADVLKKVRLDGSELQELAPVPRILRSAGWCPDGDIVLHSTGLQGLARVPASGGGPHPIPIEDGPALRWLSLVPDCRSILAGSIIANDTLVVAVRLDTGERIPLFPGQNPRFVSPGYVVYWRNDALWAAPFDPERLVDTGPHIEIVQGVSSDPNQFARFAVVPNLLVYQAGRGMSGAGGTPVWVDRDGTEEALPQLPRGDYRWPRISPDGTKLLIMRVAEAGNRDIWIYDLITGASRQLTFAPEDDYGSIWNPAGDRVVFGSTRDGSGNLYWRTADGSDSAEQLTTGSNGKLAHTWTRDGRLVYSEVVPGQDRDLFAISPTGDRTPTALLAQPYAERNAAVSPNGRWIAYESTQLGFPGAWVKSFPDLLGDRRISTLDLGRLLAFDLDPTEGRSPIWSRDGNELFYNNQSAIVRIPITSEDPFTTGSPEFLFSGPYFGATTTGPQYDIAGDGRFIMIRTLEGISNELIVVQNWMRELWERN